jgi:hypothetical protein
VIFWGWEAVNEWLKVRKTYCWPLKSVEPLQCDVWNGCSQEQQPQPRQSEAGAHECVMARRQVAEGRCASVTGKMPKVTFVMSG